MSVPHDVTAIPRIDRRLLQALLAGGGLWLAWRLCRGLKSAFWTVFGIGMALYWTGAWHWLPR